MKTIYFIAAGAVLLAVVGAYWAGGRAGRADCRAEIATESDTANIAAQNQLIETKGEINAEIYHTGAADIRGMLRAKYTIAE